jgi:ABC-2 type transport system permease protein
MKKSLPSLVLHESRYDLLIFVRNEQSLFYTLGLPVLFLVIFASVFGSGQVDLANGSIKESVYYVPGIMALGVISASFINLVISVTAARERGIYKRRRATPVPAWVVIMGRALTAVVIALLIAALLLGIGWAAYGASVPGRTAPALVLDVVVGAIAFCGLAYAVASIVKDQESAQPITQAVMLPLYFISGIFVPSTSIPSWLKDIASIFPVHHLANALLIAYNPHTVGSGFAWKDIGIVAVWGLAGLLFALRRFSWLPTGR